MENPIIVALDVPTADQALDLAAKLAPVTGCFKIGSELFTAAGPEIVQKIRGLGASVFLDLKFHDIPNTVAKSVASATRAGVKMLTIHTSGGAAMMEAAEKSAQETALRCGGEAPLVLGVTVLTSMDKADLSQTGVEDNVGHHVERLALLAARSGLRGLVCSPLEIADLRQAIPTSMKLVTPGIRPADAEKGDQKRTLTPKEAIDAGADWLVIGRPIYGAPNPREAAEKILASLK